MGLFDGIRNQFIEVIEWTDDSRDTLVYRFPVSNQEIKMGAQLTVRESQNALFINEGKVADLYKPGRFQLTTRNMPVLTKLRSWSTGFNSPFKAEVYFFNMRQFTDLKWGTANPITVRDPELGAARIRAFGIYAMRLKDPGRFYQQVSGTEGLFTVDGISGQLRGAIVNRFSDLLAESKIPFVDASAHLEELSRFGAERLQGEFDSFGLELTKFLVENVSLPAEVERVLDKKTGMNVIGADMGKYAQFQAADAVKDAAQNPGGVAGAGIGMGLGVGMGQMMSDAMKQGQAPACPKCKAPLTQPAKFCPLCGQAL